MVPGPPLRSVRGDVRFHQHMIPRYGFHSMIWIGVGFHPEQGL